MRFKHSFVIATLKLVRIQTPQTCLHLPQIDLEVVHLDSEQEEYLSDLPIDKIRV